MQDLFLMCPRPVPVWRSAFKGAHATAGTHACASCSGDRSLPVLSSVLCNLPVVPTSVERCLRVTNAEDLHYVRQRNHSVHTHCPNCRVCDARDPPQTKNSPTLVEFEVRSEADTSRVLVRHESTPFRTPQDFMAAWSIKADTGAGNTCQVRRLGATRTVRGVHEAPTLFLAQRFPRVLCKKKKQRSTLRCTCWPHTVVPCCLRGSIHVLDLWLLRN